MRITIESDPGYAGRNTAHDAAARIRAAMPEAEVVVTGAADRPRLPATYRIIAARDYGVRMMLRQD